MARKALNKLLTLVDNANTQAPIEKQFINDLTYSIEQKANMNVHKPSQAFKPSSIGGCVRNLYYQLSGAPVSKEGRSNASSVGILENGTDRHLRIQEAIASMKESGIDCEYIDVETFVKEFHLNHIQIVGKSGMETKCYWEEIPLSFLTDGIIKYQGKYYILEIKTMNSAKFFDSKDVRAEHKDQGICYSMAFHINDVMYLYEDRDSLAKKAFVFHVTDEMRETLYNKTLLVKKSVADGKPPAVDKDRQKCTYCMYHAICTKDE